MKLLRKYLAVVEITVRSRMAYLGEQLLSGFSVLIFMVVFVALWRTTFAVQGAERVDGYTLPQMIWYLVATEAIVLSLPRIHATIEGEVKGGDLAIRLNKPYSYLLFHYAATLGDALLRLASILLVGGLTAYLLVGPIPFRWEGVVPLLLLYISTQALNFCWNATIGLCAFWVEDVLGIFLVLDKIKWLLGGFLLPVELYPDVLKALVKVLPFHHMIGGPAHLFVQFSWEGALELGLAQLAWLPVLALMCGSVYRLGVRKVDVNGG
jgi:ABC-2 type transport system permease protein